MTSITSICISMTSSLVFVFVLKICFSVLDSISAADPI